VLLASLACLIQADASALKHALDAGDFADAWNLAAGEVDPVARARSKAEVFYRAGDPAAALASCLEGLREAPDDLELLHRAVSSALWLGDSGAASDLAGRLARAVERSILAPDYRPAWEEASRDLMRRASELVRHERMRTRALSRARALAFLGTGIALGLLVLGAVRQVQGRSSSPVS
jgi:hypothetical protein